MRDDTRYRKTNALIDPKEYRALQRVLVDRDQSFSAWVRKKIREELAKSGENRQG